MVEIVEKRDCKGLSEGEGEQRVFDYGDERGQHSSSMKAKIVLLVGDITTSANASNSASC